MKRQYFLLTLMLMHAIAIFGQALPIRISISIAPPYPPSMSYYADHPQQVLIFIINTSAKEQSFRLVGSIIGTDNNVKVVAKDRAASGIITLNPSESRLLTVPEIQDLFEPSKFAYTGISYSKAQIDDGLPEGTYEVCGYAVDAYQVNVKMGDEVCSNPIFVTNLEPPMVISPFQNSRIEEMAVQNIVFTWTLPASAPITTEYTLKMVEVMGNLNINNAIQSATTPVFFEKTVQFNTLLYGPADPPLIAGRRYAFVITATDQMGKAVFRNGGRSEVHSFVYEAGTVQNVPVSSSSIKLISPTNKSKIAPVASGINAGSFEFSWDGVSAFAPDQMYQLKIAKLGEGQTPLQALTSNDAILTTAGGNKTGKVIFMPKNVFGFAAGNYAWQVSVVMAGTGKMPSKPIQSNIYTFTSGSSQIKVGGTIKYRMASAASQAPVIVGSGSNKRYAVTKSIGKAEVPTYPLANKEVKLVLSYAVKASDLSTPENPVDPSYVVDGMCDFSPLIQLWNKSTVSTSFPNAGKVLAKTTTNQFGVFNTFIYEDLGEKIELQNGNYPPIQLFKIIKVMPADPENRYTTADGFLIGKLNPTASNPNNVDIASKDFVVRALTFQLKVNLANLPQKNYLGNQLVPENSIETKTDVYVLRKNKKLNANFPDHEGDDASNNQTLKIGNVTYDIISQQIAELGQQATFKNLVRNKPGLAEDKFYIYAKLKNTSGEILEPQEFKSYFKWNSYYFYNIGTEVGNDDGNKVDQQFDTKTYDEHDYIGNDNTNELTLKPNKLTNTIISGVLKSHWTCNLMGIKKNDKQDKPLVNTTITLQSHFVFKPDGKNYTVDVPNYHGYPTQTFGTTKSDGNGNFTFNVNIGFTGADYENNSQAIYSDASQNNGLGWVEKNYSFTGAAGSGYLTNAKGTLYKALKILVDNPYVTSPDEAIMVSPGYKYNVGTFTANVREGDLAVTAKTTSDNNPNDYNTALPGAKVYLCRPFGKNNAALPIDEGNINSVVSQKIKVHGVDYKVLAEDKTDVNGKVYFSRLVKSNNIADYYFVVIKPDEMGDKNYEGSNVVFLTKSCKGVDANKNPNKSIFNSDEPCLTGINCYNVTVEADALPPAIAGTVYPDSKMSFNPIAGAKVQLFTINESKYQDYLLPKFIKTASDKNQFSDKMSHRGIQFMQNNNWITKEGDPITVSDNGKFLFENLKPMPNGQQPRRLLWIDKAGFLDEVVLVNSATPLKNGQRANVGSVFLRLPINVTAEVTDAEDQKLGVKVKAIVGENYSWAASTPSDNCYFQSIGAYKQYVCTEQITLPSPHGQVEVTFYPEDADNYLPFTTTLNIPSGKADYSLPFKILMSRKKHKIAFIVKEKGANKFPKTVKVSLVNSVINNVKTNATKSSEGSLGIFGGPGQYSLTPRIEFRSVGNTFTFKFSAFGYVPQEVYVFNEPSEDYIFKTIELEPAGVVSGIVTNTDKKPVNNAKVYYDGNAGTVETTTDSEGKYELNGIPLNKNITIKASYTGYIGDEKTINTEPVSGGGMRVYINGKWQTISANLNSEDATHFKLNFMVTEMADLDITKIAGFPVEITEATKKGKNYLVSGRFIDLPANPVFSYTSDKSVKFHDIEIVSGNEKYGTAITATPSGKPMAALKNSCFIDNFVMPITLYSKVQGNLQAASFSGIVFEETSFNKGVLNASIFGNLSSFPSGIENSKTLSKSATPNFPIIPVGGNAEQYAFATFTADKSYATAGFNVKQNKNVPYRFRLHQYYETEADIKSTFIDGELNLNTTIHTNLDHFADGGDINLNLGKVVVTSTDGVLNINGTSSLIFNLGKAVKDKSTWSIQSDKWTFGKGGLVLKKGTLNTGIGVTFTNMLVTDTKLLFGDYNTTGGLTLGNDIILTLEPTATLSFGFDGGYGDGAWALSIQPGANKSNCASFSLPDVGSAFQISNIKSYSTGEMQIGLNTFTPVKLYNKTAVFRPATINVSEGYVNIEGDLDFEIPKMPIKDSYALTFKKINGKLTMQPKKRNYSIELNGVKINFPEKSEQTLDANGLTLIGTLEDKVKDVYQFDVKLTKKPTGEIAIVTIGDNKYYTSKDKSKGLEEVSGAMSVQSDNRWNNFAFNGKMFGYDGIRPEERTLYMLVKGDLEADPKSKIGVSNMDAGMGNMSIVYDFNRKALVGTLHTQQNISGCGVEMDLELFFGSSNWYLFGSGNASLPSGFPISSLKVAFLVGKFKVPELSQTITNTFSQFTWNKKLPLALSSTGEGNSNPAKGEITKNGYNETYIGILFAGGFAMPIPYVPEININLKPIAQASLTHEIHANIVLGLNFTDKSIAIDANVGAALNLGVGASLGLVCATLNLNVSADVFAAGKLQVAPLTFVIIGGAQVTLGGSMMVGGGLCDSDCDGYLCTTTSTSRSITLLVTIMYASGQSPVFKFE